MRRAYNYTMWILNDDREVIGLALGADTTSEHSVGYDELMTSLGIQKEFQHGLADRKAKRTPPAFWYREYELPDGTPAAILLVGDIRGDIDKLDPLKLPPILAQEVDFRTYEHQPKRGNLVCAWDSRGFCINVKTDEQVDRLRQFHQAIAENDIAIGTDLINKDDYPRAGGLILVRPSMLHPQVVKDVYEKDQKGVRLKIAAQATGIHQELLDAGKRWFALSPRWKDEQESEVLFWLNPYNQKDYKSGLYSVDELRLWAKDEGPIIIDKRRVELTEKYQDKLHTISRRIEKHGFDRPSFSINWVDETKTDFVVVPRYWDNSQNQQKPRIEQRNYTLQELEGLFPAQPPRPKAKRSP